MKKLVIIFWKTVGCFLELQPRMHLPTYSDYPIACTEIDENNEYEYPNNIIILYEWNEKGRHWIVFMRDTQPFSH